MLVRGGGEEKKRVASVVSIEERGDQRKIFLLPETKRREKR